MGNDRQLKIAEMFYSLQGESSFSGYPCFFIRLADCNLRCSYCDTRYAYEEEHPLLPIANILAELDNHPGVITEITGGEPLLQENVYLLFEKLLAAGRTVLLETNGSVSLKDVPDEVFKIVDMKCPGSNMHEYMDLDNFRFMTPKDEVKFVLSSRADYDWALQIVKEHNLHLLTTVTFSPVTSELAPAELASWMLEDHLPVRLKLQLHTIIWPARNRGY